MHLDTMHCLALLDRIAHLATTVYQLLIKRALGQAKVPALLEPPGLSRTDGKRPDGVTLVPWTHGKSAVWDIAVPNTFCPTHLTSTKLRVGAAAHESAQRKRKRYEELAKDYKFVPLILETSGVWLPESLEFIKRIGALLTISSGEPLSTEHFLQLCSIELQRGNCRCILASFGAGYAD